MNACAGFACRIEATGIAGGFSLLRTNLFAITMDGVEFSMSAREDTPACRNDDWMIGFEFTHVEGGYSAAVAFAAFLKESAMCG